MKKWLLSLLKKDPIDTSSSNDTLALNSKVRSLEIDLIEREKTIQSLQKELDRLRIQQNHKAETMLSTQLEKFFCELAPALSQSMTQKNLIEFHHKELSPEDFILVNQRFLNVLEKYGLTTVGEIGSHAQYNPSHHFPLSTECDLQVGQPVKIRMVGFSYLGKILLKASVEGDNGVL